jgi:hypothetical protein
MIPANLHNVNSQFFQRSLSTRIPASTAAPEVTKFREVGFKVRFGLGLLALRQFIGIDPGDDLLRDIVTHRLRHRFALCTFLSRCAPFDFPMKG